MWLAGLVATVLLIAILLVGFGSYCLAELTSDEEREPETKRPA